MGQPLFCRKGGCSFVDHIPDNTQNIYQENLTATEDVFTLPGKSNGDFQTEASGNQPPRRRKKVHLNHPQPNHPNHTSMGFMMDMSMPMAMAMPWPGCCAFAWEDDLT
jgi:hypothetical protein